MGVEPTEVSFNINGQEIKFQQQCITNDKQTRRNILAALKTKYPEIRHNPDPTEQALAIVGSGPSLKETYHLLEGWPGEIYALNSAHDFLISKGIIPNAAVAIEGTLAICKYFKNPHPDVYYLLSSACHPMLFKQLKGNKIAMFHLALHATMDAFAETGYIADMVTGASTVLTRTMSLAAMVGFRDFHFFGCDSSFFDATEQGTRKTDGTEIGDYLEDLHISLTMNEKTYRTTPQLLAQVFAVSKMMQSSLVEDEGMRFACYGDSLLQESM